MEQEKPSLLTNILMSLITLILLVVLFLALYFAYLNLPGPLENLNIDIDKPEGQEVFSQAKQFYPHMKFNHQRITYHINQDCSTQQKQRVIEGFKEIQNNIPFLIFETTLETPDIEVSCTEEEKTNTESDGKKYFVAGEGGAKEIIQTGNYYIITQGVIYLFKENKKAIQCDYPNVEVHETLHVFGFDHTNNPQSIMYPLLTDCTQTLDQSIIEELKRLYSEENLPELTFENFTATKSGRYLNFNLTIRNTGSINSEPFLLTILDNQEVVDTREIESINFGAGISLQTTNLKLIRKNPEQIQFVIDKENKIKELDKTNNIAIINP